MVSTAPIVSFVGASEACQVRTTVYQRNDADHN